MNYSSSKTHWDFSCSDRPNLKLIRWQIFKNDSLVAIDTEKNTISSTKFIKLTLEIILMELKNSARRRHRSKIFKTNLKTLISPLLNRPQGCQGCQNDREDPRINPTVRFCANIQSRLKKIRKIIKKQYFFHDFLHIFEVFRNFFNFGSILAQKRTIGLILGSFRSF